MKTLSVTWKGLSPLIMHSCRTVNPLHPLAIEIKKYTSKRNKTEEDYRNISDLEWLAGLYYSENIDNPLPSGLKDDMYIFIPAECVEATIINGAKANKKGTAIEKFVSVPELEAIFDFGCKKTISELYQDYKYRDVRQMVVNRSRITRTRPRFDRWAIQFNLQYDEKQIDIDTIVNAIEYGGQYVGLCDSRPKYGKFAAIVEELS